MSGLEDFEDKQVVTNKMLYKTYVKNPEWEDFEGSKQSHTQRTVL